MEIKPIGNPTRIDYITASLLALSTLLNCGLAITLLRVSHTLVEPTGARSTTDPVGMAMDSIRLRGVDGHEVELPMRGDRETVLYFLSPSCAWCDRNVVSIRALAEGAGAKYRFVGISVALTGDLAVQRDAYGFDVFTAVDANALSRYGVSGTPTTLLVDRQGRVRRAWPGAFQGVVRDSISSFFNVELPEI